MPDNIKISASDFIKSAKGGFSAFFGSAAQLFQFTASTMAQSSEGHTALAGVHKATQDFQSGVVNKAAAAGHQDLQASALSSLAKSQSEFHTSEAQRFSELAVAYQAMGDECAKAADEWDDYDPEEGEGEEGGEEETEEEKKKREEAEAEAEKVYKAELEKAEQAFQTILQIAKDVAELKTTVTGVQAQASQTAQKVDKIDKTPAGATGSAGSVGSVAPVIGEGVREIPRDPVQKSSGATEPGAQAGTAEGLSSGSILSKSRARLDPSGLSD